MLTSLSTSAIHADETTIDVRADRVLHAVSRHLTGACLEDVNHEVYGGIYSQMVFGESFQEPALSPDIEGFKSYGGLWVVRDGALQTDGGDGPKLVSSHAPFKDGAAGVELFFADRNGQSAGLVVRLRDPGVGADKFVGYEVALDPGKQTLSLARHRNNYEPIDDVHCEVATGRWVPLEVHLAGSVIEVMVDGKRVLRHEDAEHALAAGTVALRPWHREAGYRNLWVKPGEQVEPLPFAQPDAPKDISGMWRAIIRGPAVGHYAIVKEKPFTGTQSQQITFDSGQGEIGIENQGLNRWGMNFQATKDYQGYVWVRAEKPVTLLTALESRDGSQVYAEKSLAVAAGDWQRVDFTLTPSATDSAGRFALKLKEPGSVTIGHALLQPGEWGRFQGLRVRRDVAEGLINQGVTFLRYGGSMVNNPGYQWKNMIGPRDRRPPYSGTWYAWSSNGWGIADFMAFCEAAGFEYVPAFNMGQTPQDMADFVDYAEAPADSEWGRKRALDGHPEPFRVRFLELGNEERVDEKYAEKFEALARAIWAKDPKMVLVVGDFAYDRPIADPFQFAGAASRITTLAAHQRILRFARQHDGEVWFDVHVWTDHPEAANSSLIGLLSFTDALDKIADGARHKVVVFEFNSGNHAQKRALANALAVIAIERDGRIPIVSVANCLQPDKQNDNGWDQGLLFLNPSQVWLQPPGYLTHMLSANYLPQLVQCEVAAAGTKLNANSKRSEDGKTLLLQVVNPGGEAVTARINLSGFNPTKSTAELTELSGPPEAANSADRPDAIVPRHAQWQHGLSEGRAAYKFPAYSVTFLRFE